MLPNIKINILLVKNMNEQQLKEKEELPEGLEKLKVIFISADSDVVVAKHMHNQFLKMGHESHYIPNVVALIEILDSEGRKVSVSKYSSMGNPYNLEKFIKFKGFDHEEIDIIFIEQNFMYFENDVKSMVVYYHRDLWTECFMRRPDMLLYRYAKHRTALQYYARYTWVNTLFKLQFINAVDMNLFKHNRQKQFKGINYIYPRQTLETYLTTDFVQRDYYQPTYDILEFAKKKGWVNIHGFHRTTTEEYRWILTNCETILFMPPNNAFLSRILYECAASKTMLLIYAPTVFAEEQYRKIGLVHKDNCLIVRKKEQIMNVYIMNKRKIEKIVNNAYDWVKRLHTYEIRAKQLQVIFYKLLMHKGGSKWEKLKDYINPQKQYI